MDLQSRINAIAKDIGLKKLTPDTPFRELGIDSLDAMNLIMRLERETGVTIPDDQLVKIKTLRELQAVMDGLQKDAPQAK